MPHRHHSLFTGAFLLVALVSLLFCAPHNALGAGAASPAPSVAALESSFDGRLGLFALDTGTGNRLEHRADERFPVCSTFKVVLVAAVLKQDMSEDGFLDRRISFGKDDLLSWAPITKERLDSGMSVAELCAATLQYSDNTAANLLLDLVGGPEGLTAFARSCGDEIFRLDRREPELNSALPGDPRDTSTPAAMADLLRRLLLGDVLDPPRREQLERWMRGNTTGNAGIRAGVPEGWIVGDKTGSGDYGTANDIAIIRPPQGAPIILVVYSTQNKQDAAPRRDLQPAVTRAALQVLSRP